MQRETYDHYLNRAMESQNTDVLRLHQERKRQERRELLTQFGIVAGLWIMLAVAVVLT